MGHAKKNLKKKIRVPKHASDARIMRPFSSYILAEEAMLDGDRGKPYCFAIERTKAFVIADLHFNDMVIFSMCRRGCFSSVEAMNAKLISNWNSVVDVDDIVFVLGDITGSVGSRQYLYWLSQLNGQKVIVKGNHDVSVSDCCTEVRLKFKGQEFLLVHKPEKGEKFNGWVIHGHKHRNTRKKFPFFDPRERRINVCAELIGFVPLSVERLCQLIVAEQSSSLVYLPDAEPKSFKR